MRMSIMNGTNSSVPSMNGTNMVVPSLNGTNMVVPMNGTNAVVPMQGRGGVVYYVAPISLLDVADVPSDWIPTGLSNDDILYLKTAYMMGDPQALNGKLGDKLKNIANKAKEIIPIVGKSVASAVSTVIPGGKALVAASEANHQKFQAQVNNAIAQTNAIIESKQAAPVVANEAKKIAGIATKELVSVGINANPEVIADRALMAADAGVTTKDLKSGDGFLSGFTTTEKMVGAGGLILLSIGTYKYFKGKKGKGGRKK